ncbi:class I SAM-dependent methyltransferase [Dactylosporangium sp. CA-139066]|uniref:class I SAM-dependent methyltransferase n=1 Tax=Dactylosporangium sp. CA-139066 TaxID=3239930 RepID=UPI003D8EF846
MSRVGRALAELRHEVTTPGVGLDRLRLVEVPLVPEVQLYLAEDAIVWWARMEARAGMKLPPPFWSSAWAGGKAVARYVLDHPATVAGRRVLDLAAGSGLVAIAAGKAGAAAVTANDVDPYAVAAITLNAKANGVRVVECLADLLDGDGGDAETVLAGDIFYTGTMARRVLAFLERVAARGAEVLVGDPGRKHLPRGRLQTIATYELPLVDAFADAQLTQMNVLRLR